MPRYSDEWLIDRVLFDYVNGGTCACCSFATIFLPGGTAELIGTVSDIETDQVNAEITALSTHPWPTDLRDHVWSSRVRLRQKLKSTMSIYKEFWNTYDTQFIQWCRINHILVNRLLQLPRSEIMDTFEPKYGIHSAFKAVMEAVVEQVSHFHLTGYPTDGRGEVEINFENALGFSRYSGFTMEVSTSNNINEDILNILLQRMKTLGGPKLLERGIKVDNDEDDVDGDGDVDGPTSSIKKQQLPTIGPSFQSDRRLVRLIIAREWSDLLIERFKKDILAKNEENVEN